MTGEYGLVLTFSVLALAISVYTSLRNPAQRLSEQASEALTRSLSTQTANEAFKAEVISTLGAIQDERERTEKARARARSAQQRVEQAEGNAAPHSREEELARLRKQAGLL
jgi:ABC-type protease/lipase transport system fused ATPase/permease subunit